MSMILVGIAYAGGGSSTTVTYERAPIIIEERLSESVPAVVVEEKPTLRPELIKICECESGGRQFEADGSVRTSHTADSGLCQINEIHEKEASRLGMDIMTEAGNIKFANHLFDREGYAPWEASRHCWQK